MGRRSLLRKFQVLSSADSAADPTSEVTDVSSVDFITYQIEIANTVDAVLAVEFCNDDSGDYKELNFNQTLSLDGASETDYLVHVENKAFKNLRLAITNNGGTGSIDAWVSGSVKGA